MEDVVVAQKVTNTNIDDIGEEFYGEDGYNEDELTDLDAFEGNSID